MPLPPRILLKLSCPDRIGIVAAVSTLIAELRGCIVEAQHHSDVSSRRFFMRQVIDTAEMNLTLEQVRERFRPLAQKFDMDWLLRDEALKKRVAILVSKQDHCLNDLLYRWRSGELNFELAGVISNHLDCQSFVAWHGVPYAHIAVQKDDKAAAFAAVRRQIEQWDIDTIVLARYMQILPPELCAVYSGRIINIHHSFLPSFVGPRPYHQAFERGVKWVGATSHYVTAELDAGPIIEQDATRTHHAHDVEQMIRIGRDVEAAVLARALRLHLEDRVFVIGNKTVVFAA
ncbi:MAG: formyltetrahydrofolate deformylase [Phycisphaeraceae bacterium]|nr:formyltetrahydrofolate deformylase [Phycisphaeraceae bacterium]